MKEENSELKFYIGKGRRVGGTSAQHQFMQQSMEAAEKAFQQKSAEAMFLVQQELKNHGFDLVKHNRRKLK